jgi:hypothetical protein
MLQHLNQHTLDKNKWDALVKESPAANLCHESWFMDIMAPGWELLVQNDYEAAFLITPRKKWGMKYLYQPPLIQQGGVFSRYDETIDAGPYLEVIKQNIKFAEITLNSGNFLLRDDIEKKYLRNQTLSLSKTGDELEKAYSENHRRNIRKGKNAGLQYREDAPVEKIVSFFRENPGNNQVSLKNSDYENLIRMAGEGKNRGRIQTPGVYDAGGNLVAGIILGVFPGRITLLFSGQNPSGKDRAAMFFLIDEILKRNSGQNAIFDFEGSNAEGLSRFYGGFGSSDSVYLHIRYNSLPFPWSMLKK